MATRGRTIRSGAGGVNADMSDAVVIGASGGLGAAFVRALEADRRYARVFALSRRTSGLDVRREDDVARAAAALRAAAAEPRLVLVATGVLDAAGARPERSFAEIDPARMADTIAANAVGPALVFKHFLPLLPKSGRSAIAALSARVGSIGDNRLGGWMSYRASKAALNQIVRCAAVEAARTRPEAVVAALHPGTVDTALSRDHARGRYTATADEAARAMLAALDGLSVSGAFLAYDGTPVPW